MSPSAPERLEFFIDRSLGRYAIAAGLRRAGWTVITMAEVYGETLSQQKDDPPWLQECGAKDWTVLSKDVAMLRKQRGGAVSLQLDAIRDGRVRVFLLMSQNLSAADQLLRFTGHTQTIRNIVATRKGPYVYGVYSDGMREIWPRRSSRVHRPERHVPSGPASAG